MNMNKKTIITILLALVAILSVSIVLKGQGNETKSAEKHSPHYYVIGAIFSNNTARAIPL